MPDEPDNNNPADRVQKIKELRALIDQGDSDLVEDRTVRITDSKALAAEIVARGLARKAKAAALLLAIEEGDADISAGRTTAYEPGQLADRLKKRLATSRD